MIYFLVCCFWFGSLAVISRVFFFAWANFKVVMGFLKSVVYGRLVDVMWRVIFIVVWAIGLGVSEV